MAAVWIDERLVMAAAPVYCGIALTKFPLTHEVFQLLQERASWHF